MSEREELSCAGRVERGWIKEVSNEGYKIESYDRKGIVTPPIKPFLETTYKAGEGVYYFCFPDGTGRILCSM